MRSDTYVLIVFWTCQHLWQQVRVQHEVFQVLFIIKLYTIIFLNYSVIIFVKYLIFQRLQEFPEISARVLDRQPSGSCLYRHCSTDF